MRYEKAPCSEQKNKGLDDLSYNNNSKETFSHRLNLGDLRIVIPETLPVVRVLSPREGQQLLDKPHEAPISAGPVVSYKERVQLDLPPSLKLSPTTWYRQRDERTCTTWATANAAIAIDAHIDAELLMHLLPTKENQAEYEGLHLAQAAEIVNTKQNAFRLSVAEKEIWPKSRGMYEGVVSEDHIRQTAQIVKDVIDDKAALITAVQVRGTPRQFPRKAHAICIKGYRVTQDGTMDVQVVDSLRGASLRSIEDIAHDMAEVGGYLMKVEKSSELLK